MILITGATGQLGNATLHFLAKNHPDLPLAALARDLDKAADIQTLPVDIRRGNYDDYDSLLNAFKGIDKLFFVSANDIPNRVRQQTNVVNAAKEAGVKHIVYTSFQRKTEGPGSPIAMVAEAHIDTENKIKATGIPYTILKNALYTDLLPWFMGEDVLKNGEVFLPAGDGKTAFALRSDLAEAAARILAEDGHENKTYELSGPVSVDLYDVARYLTDLSGKTVTYSRPDRDLFLKTLAEKGVPAEVAGMFAAFSQGIAQGEFDFPDATLEKLLGRKAVSVEAYLRGVYAPATV